MSANRERDFYLTLQADQLYDLYDAVDNMVLLMKGGTHDLSTEQAAPILAELEKAKEAARQAHQIMVNVLVNSGYVAVPPLPVPTKDEDVFAPSVINDDDDNI